MARCACLDAILAFGWIGFMSCIDSKIRFPTCLPPVPIVASWPFPSKAPVQVVEHEEQTRQLGPRSFSPPRRPRPAHRSRSDHPLSLHHLPCPVLVPVRPLPSFLYSPLLPLFLYLSPF